MKDRIQLRPLVYEDVVQFLNWGRHEDCLLAMYNFNESAEDLRRWYSWKTSSFNSIYFAIVYDGRSVGYIGLKDILRFKRQAELGIIIDKNFMDQGIGSVAIGEMLDYGFYTLRLDKIILEVLPWNARARHCYEKLGFVKTGQRWCEVDLERNEETEKALEPYRKRVRRIGEHYYIHVDRMELKAKERLRHVEL